MVISKLLSFIRFCIWGPTEIPSFIFSHVIFKKLCSRVLKTCSIFWESFCKLFRNLMPYKAYSLVLPLSIGVFSWQWYFIPVVCHFSVKYLIVPYTISLSDPLHSSPTSNLKGLCSFRVFIFYNYPGFRSIQNHIPYRRFY